MMIYAITCAFIVLDFATGLIKAVATDKFKSSMMRQGLFHKVGEILCVALGILIQYAEGYLDLGINLPVAAAICTYIVRSARSAHPAGQRRSVQSAPAPSRPFQWR